MNVLLSIKPEFADRILSGEKRYEFRKSVFRDPGAVDSVIMYASSPVKRIVGFFTFSEIIEFPPKVLWQKYGDRSGIANEERFFEYFEGKETGYALKIEEVSEFAEPVDPTSAVEGFRPPVSFKYVNGEFDQILERAVPYPMEQTMEQPHLVEAD